jgi:DNA-binding LytR/AlgR family response regulator
MLNIVILEDQADQAERLTRMLEKYASSHPDFAYALKRYERSIPLLTEYKCDADILFLDIQVPDMLGMEAAKKIRAMDNKVMIIFITMLTQYAIEGYSVGAFDYVLKPVRYEEFSTKMDRACRMLAHQNTSMTLEVRTKEEIRRVNADEITFIEVSNHDVLIHTDSEIIRQWGNLKSYEDKLAPVHFIRCSASFLVNLKYVRAVNGSTVMVHGHELPVSASKRREFLMALAQYKGGSR